mmetsp:Transcript_45578/g.98399  ORF Transcript_45578/g.98399 Transcript_45578/m.98399 type:complete len:235 (-) Transcript_45578:548-1252(-)
MGAALVRFFVLCPMALGGEVSQRPRKASSSSGRSSHPMSAGDASSSSSSRSSLKLSTRPLPAAAAACGCAKTGWPFPAVTVGIAEPSSDTVAESRVSGGGAGRFFNVVEEVPCSSGPGSSSFSLASSSPLSPVASRPSAFSPFSGAASVASSWGASCHLLGSSSTREGETGTFNPGKCSSSRASAAARRIFDGESLPAPEVPAAMALAGGARSRGSLSLSESFPNSRRRASSLM